jgi:3-deoxy-D-manno-octulosonate 8-phosphate phosphatase KdsC-like HAD superfamily phosphatase
LQGYFNASGLFVTDGLGSLSQVATTRTSVASLNGVTGAVNLFAGTGLSVASSTSIRGITFTNTGVLSIDGATGAITNVARTNVGQTFTALQSFSSGISASGGTLSGTFNLNGSSILTSANAVTSVDGVTGAVDLLAGTGISITLPTGAAKGITLANTGVIGITGTANQVAVNATTGSVTLSLPSAITTPGSLTVTGNLTASSDLTVTGNLTVNGTSTTVNSTTVTVQDPLIAIGGLTGNIPPVTGDVKDRGILYQYFSTVGRTGFFGHDTSTGRFTYLPFVTSVSSDVVTGTAGIAEFSGVYAPQGILELTALSGSSPIARITVDGTVTNGSISYSGNTHTFGASPAGPGTVPSLVLASSLSSSVITSTAAISQKTFTLPNISGTALVADAAGATSGWLLRAAGPSTQSTWVNPNAAGFTAFTSTNIITTSDTSDQVCFVTFVNTNTDGSQSLRYNSGFTYNAQTNYLEVNIDGGAY